MSQFQPRTPSAAASPPGEVPQRKQSANIPVRIFAICLTSVIVAVHYTNYGPLIPTLIGDLHITGGQAGLLSTFLFLGLAVRSEEHTSELQSRSDLVCRLLLEKKKTI